MMRAFRVATLIGALTITIAGCSGGHDLLSDAEPAAAQAEKPKMDERADGGRYRKVTFDATGAPTPTVLTPNCNPAHAADCILPTNFSPTKLTGDVRGTAFGSAVVIGRNGVYPGSSIVSVAGEVKGCGTGGLVINTVGTFDPSSGLTTGTWTINADGGTGDLADVAGHGTSVVDGAGGRYTGRIRCR